MTKAPRVFRTANGYSVMATKRCRTTSASTNTSRRELLRPTAGNYLGLFVTRTSVTTCDVVHVGCHETVCSHHRSRSVIDAFASARKASTTAAGGNSDADSPPPRGRVTLQPIGQFGGSPTLPASRTSAKTPKDQCFRRSVTRAPPNGKQLRWECSRAVTCPRPQRPPSRTRQRRPYRAKAAVPDKGGRAPVNRWA